MNSRQRANLDAAQQEGIAVQPFGLTNFQSKVVGRLVTRSWRALRGWNESLVARHLGQAVVDGGRVLAYDDALKLLDDDLTSDPQDLRHCRSTPYTSATATSVPEQFISYSRSRIADARRQVEKWRGPATRFLGDSFEVVRAHTLSADGNASLQSAPPAAKSAIELLRRPPVVWLPFSWSAGHAWERAASVAICGTEILFPAISAKLMRMAARDDTLQGALTDVGITETPADYRRFGFVLRAYREGSRMSRRDEAVKLALIAAYLNHRVVLVEQKRCVVFKPPSASASSSPTAKGPAVVFSGSAVGIAPTTQVAGGDVFAWVCVGSRDFLNKDARVIERMPISDAAGPSSPAAVGSEFETPKDVLNRVYQRYHEGTIAQWFGSELPPCAFSLDCAERTYHVEVRTSMLKAGRREAALIEAPGFGRDPEAQHYLRDKLPANLVPLHVDADGHCLSHSLSRCLIGKEYLWHALRKGLAEYMDKFRGEFETFFKKHPVLAAIVDHETGEFDELIARANPDRKIQAGELATTNFGLGTEHVFAFANMLRRPIVLFDGSAAHRESYVFLPLLPNARKMSTRAALGIAWYSAERLHYIPTVPRSSNVAPINVADCVPLRHDGLPQVYGLEDPADILAVLQELLPNPQYRGGAGGSGSATGSPHSTSPSGSFAHLALGNHPWLIEIGASSVEQSGTDAVVAAASPPRSLGSSGGGGGGGSSNASPDRNRGGSGSLDEHISRTLGEFVVTRFAEVYKANIWSVHEVARAAAMSRDYQEFDALFSNPDINGLADRCLRQLRGTDARFCEDCTATSLLTPHSTKCRGCGSGRITSAMDLNTGSFTFNEGACMALDADPEIVGVRERRFKAWVNNTAPVGTVKEYVFARESASTHSVAQVTDMYYDPLSRQHVVDVCFFSDARRFAVPPCDVVNGYPVDLRKVESIELAGYGRQQVPVLLDAHNALCTDPAKAARKLAQDLALSQDAESDVANQLSAAVNKLREGDFTHASGFTSHPSQAIQPLEDGRIVVWESLDMSYGARNWVTYDDVASIQIESCYLANDTTAEIEIDRYGLYTIDFEHMMQYSRRTQGQRQIQRLYVTPEWACPVCTFVNQWQHNRCTVCEQGTIPKDTVTVVRDTAIAKKEREERVFKDPALAKGGQLFEVADGAALRIFNKYKDITFVLVPGHDRYLPLADTIGTEHPLHPLLLKLEEETPETPAVEPFRFPVRMIQIDRARFVRERDLQNEVLPSFVCSLFGKKLKTPSFLDFALADTALHGEDGPLYREGRVAQEVTSAVQFADYYGENLFFMSCTKSGFPRPLFVPVSKNIRSHHPLYHDINAEYQRKVGANYGRRLEEFAFQGWRLRYNSRDDFFEAMGTVANLRAREDRW